MSVSRSWVVASVLCVTLLVLDLGSVVPNLRPPIASSLRPGRQLVSWGDERVTSAMYWWKWWRRGPAYLAQLEHESVMWQERQATFSALLAEQERLRAALELPAPPRVRRVGWYGGGTNWFVEMGCREGLQVGEAITYQGNLLGITQETLEHVSRVQTVRTAEWSVPVRVQPAGAMALAQTRRGFLELAGVPLATTLKVDDLVVTVGGERIPGNIPIGLVQSAVEQPELGAWQVTLKPFVRPEDALFAEVFELNSSREETCQSSPE